MSGQWCETTAAASAGTPIVNRTAAASDQRVERTERSFVQLGEEDAQLRDAARVLERRDAVGLGERAHAAASSAVLPSSGERLNSTVVAGQRHERLLERSLLRRQLVERDPVRGGCVADLLGRSARAPRGSPRSRAVDGDAGAVEHGAQLGGLRRADADDLRRGAARRTRRRSCRRSAGRGRSRSGDRRSAPSRSSGARRRRPCGPRRRGPLSRLRIQWMPSGSSPFTGSSRISVDGSPSSAVAIPSRWPMPSENWPARLLRHVVQADEVDQLVDAALRDPVRLREREQVVVGRAAGVDGARLEQRADLVQRRRDDRGSACRSRSRRRRSARRARGSGASSSTCRSRSGRGSRSRSPGRTRERQVVDGALVAVVLRQVACLDHHPTVPRRPAAFLNGT